MLPRPIRVRSRIVGLTVLGAGLLAVGSAWAGLWPPWTIAVERLLVGAYKIYTYRGGHAGEPILAATGSRGALSVDRWLRAHPSGWTGNWVSYAPRRYVQADRFTLNIFPTRAILNYQAGAAPDRWNQVTRAIDPGDQPDLFDPIPPPAPTR